MAANETKTIDVNATVEQQPTDREIIEAIDTFHPVVSADKINALTASSEQYLSVPSQDGKSSYIYAMVPSMESDGFFKLTFQYLEQKKVKGEMQLIETPIFTYSVKTDLSGDPRIERSKFLLNSKALVLSSDNKRQLTTHLQVVREYVLPFFSRMVLPLVESKELPPVVLWMFSLMENTSILDATFTENVSIKPYTAQQLLAVTEEVVTKYQEQIPQFKALSVQLQEAKKLLNPATGK